MSHTPVPASPEAGHGPARNAPEGHLTVGDVVALVEAAAPPGLATSQDSNGLICGDPAEPVHSTLLVVDLVTAVVDEAIGAGVGMAITHYPPYLQGVGHVTAADPKGRTVRRLIHAGVALLNAHTSLDTAHGGVVDALAECIGLISTVPLEPDPASPDQGIGRIGTSPQPITLRRFTEDIASALPDSVPGLLVGEDLDAVVERIAVSSEAGDFLLQRARQAGADVFLTADLRYHSASEHLEDSRPHLLCGTHRATEWVGLGFLARKLTENAHSRGASLTVQVSRIVTDPWALRLPTGADRAWEDSQQQFVCT